MSTQCLRDGDGDAPSTMLRMVPLPRFAGEDLQRRMRCPNEKGAVARPFPILSTCRAYLIALSVIAAVQAPDGSLEMIFWSSSALAVRS